MMFRTGGWSKGEPRRESITDERLGRIGDQHLAAVAGGGDAGGATDLETDIVDTTGDARWAHLAGVDAHPYAHRRLVWPVGCVSPRCISAAAASAALGLVKMTKNASPSLRTSNPLWRLTASRMIWV
jgi:hypothetical protein